MNRARFTPVATVVGHPPVERTAVTAEGISRRHALTGAAAAGVGVPLLAACGGGASTASGSSGGGGGGAAAQQAGTTLGPTSDVPVGGGKVYADQKVVVTQPKAGEFKGFSAVCTHQGCLVSQVANGTIDCMCHGSKFSASDGSVVTGPANAPLSSVPVKAAGGEITTA